MDLFNEEADQSSDQPDNFVNPHEPLATRMRPRSMEEFAGQNHIVGEGKMLRRMIESGVIGSLIFYGPPSSGKTTLANVISREINAEFTVLNAVLDGIGDLRKVVAKAEKFRQMNDRKTILFVDEIHRWNKAQQDALLPHLESGVITLIGATTENPSYTLVRPLLSARQLFELYDLTKAHVLEMIDRALKTKERGLGNKKVEVSSAAKDHLAEYAGGDIRNALNALEVAVLSSDPDEDGVIHIDLDIARECIQKRSVRYQGTGDAHYNFASAFIKSMRGSDVDAALYWMAAMLEGGEDPNFLFRRMLILASEDVGMADPHALSMVNAAHEAFTKCGMPEGLYFLAHACIYLSLAAKSNSTGAIFSVRSEIKENGIAPIPAHLRDKTANSKQSRYKGIENASEDYIYPHSYDHHWAPQAYLSDEVECKQWYDPGSIGREDKLWNRLQQIKEAYEQASE